ncbi:MAG: hypothetical protein ABI596_01795 [Pyrinomonadaceae bacterium]
MHPLILVFLSLTFSPSAAQPARSVSKPTDDRVIIQRRRIVLVRPRSLAKEFPHKKTAIVVYPVVSGLRNPVVLRRVRTAIDFKNIFDSSLDEYRSDTWLSEFTYSVNYNRNYMLDLTFEQSGSGAYPDDQSKHFLFNLKDGSVMKATDVFEPGKLASLAAMIDRQLQSEIKQIVKENGEDAGDAHDSLKFEVSNLDDFSVGPKGVTFLYDAGFPHVIKALQPVGRYFVSYAKLSEYLKSDGLLGRFKHGSGI